MDKYGLLINDNAKLYRKYFEEMVMLHGIIANYYAPKKDKHYDRWGSLESNYEEPFKVGCIFESHPSQRTMKKLGWVSELTPEACLIHVPYDLKGIQVGALFEIPSGIDNTPDRLFKVVEMSVTMIYPSSISCKIVPEYIDKQEKSEIEQFKDTNFNLLRGEDDWLD